MAAANNITRLLDQRRIPYQAFDLPQEKLGALETARILGVPPDTVYKSIVVVRAAPGAKPILAVIPGNTQLDLKALAAVFKEKKVSLPSQRQAEALTGMQAGGISPLGLINRGFLILLDQAAASHPQIHISGGQRGLNIRLGVKDLVKLTGARQALISKQMETDDGE